MNPSLPLIIAFSDSMPNDSWSTAPNLYAFEGVNKWKASLAAYSLVELTHTDDNATDIALRAIESHSAHRIFAVGKTPAQTAFFSQLSQRLHLNELSIIALRGKTVHDNEQLEACGAHFVVSHLCEVTTLITTPPLTASLSVLLLAYNEAAVIEKAVHDVHRFCRMYAPDYEIIIVNDGSTDETAAIAHQLSKAPRVRVISHRKNMGMGASMKDGYKAASCTYVVSLPGDRQVKAHSLAAFFSHISEHTVVVSQYPVPHSGRLRHLMSEAFRLLLRHVGNLRVDVAGAYVFSTALFRKAPVSDAVASPTFLYSFQLLDAFRRNGAQFHTVNIWPFPREVGQSREAKPGRILKMAREIAAHRIRSEWNQFQK